MYCTRTTILLAVIALATPAAAQLPRTQPQRNSSNRSASSSSSANRWVRQLANDLDHLQEDLFFERGKYPQGLQEQIDQVAQAVAHFETVQAQRGDPAHLQRDFQEMDEQIHELVNNLEKTGDSWLRRQASRIRYSDEQLHYALQPKTAPPGASPRELLARQAHLLETTSRDLRELAARVNRRAGQSPRRKSGRSNSRIRRAGRTFPRCCRKGCRRRAPPPGFSRSRRRLASGRGATQPFLVRLLLAFSGTGRQSRS